MTAAVPKGRRPLFDTDADLRHGFLLIAPVSGFAPSGG